MLYFLQTNHPSQVCKTHFSLIQTEIRKCCHIVIYTLTVDTLQFTPRVQDMYLAEVQLKNKLRGVLVDKL